MSDTPPLRKNPVFLNFEDRFQRPQPFRPDVAIDIDDVFSKKIDAMDSHRSQFYEWLTWVGRLEQVPKDPADREKVAGNRARPGNQRSRQDRSKKWYGPEKAAQVKHGKPSKSAERR